MIFRLFRYSSLLMHIRWINLFAGTSTSRGLHPPLRKHRGVSVLIRRLLSDLSGPPTIAEVWEGSQYRPTPTIVEAAKALYSQHSVADISRNDAGAQNLSQTAYSDDNRPVIPTESVH